MVSDVKIKTDSQTNLLIFFFVNCFPGHQLLCYDFITNNSQFESVCHFVMKITQFERGLITLQAFTSESKLDNIKNLNYIVYLEICGKMKYLDY